MNDESREVLRNLFRNPAPRDVVRGPGLTREDLRRMNDRTGKLVETTTPGEVVLDVDGVPIGIERDQHGKAIFGGVAIFESDARRLGWTAEEFPNVIVMPDPTKRSDSNE